MPTIRERGGRFQAQVRIKRGGVIVLEKSATFETKRQATVWGMGVEDAFAKGVIQEDSCTTTVKEVVQQHVKTLVAANKDVRGINNGITALQESDLGTLPIILVESGDIIEWGKSYAVGRSPATVLHGLMVLRSVYATARAMKLKVDIQEVTDATNYLKRLGLAGKSVERDRRVTDAEIDKIARHHETLSNTTIPLRIILNLAIALPRRRGELFSNMKWQDYNGEELRLYDTKDPTKPRNEVVPVPPKARAIIDALPRSSEYILPYRPPSISNTIYNCCRITGIEDLHLHDLRHEGISRLFEAGLDIPRVAMISGHQSWTTLQRYTHLKPKDVVMQLKDAAPSFD